MRHRKHSHQLGVKKEHRVALMANLATALLKHGRIQTTLPKAKALRPFVEKIITLAKKAKAATPERALHLRRLAIARVRDKSVVHNLFETRVEEFLDRTGGYTRIYKLGARIGDAAEMALIELIDASDEGYKSSHKKKARKSKAKTAPAQPVSETAVEEADSEDSAEPAAEEVESKESAEPVADSVAEAKEPESPQESGSETQGEAEEAEPDEVDASSEGEAEKKE